ncbi:MAG: lasso peptide biosynthesis B2 protein [Bacteroidales bacterium]|nr:lasso peptide biosynthesis B2 protein [Bacteroidales bacterium]MDT8375054.1 lasso peptide biosynthesis B2 protein [Bacteroidales bacterium]
MKSKWQKLNNFSRLSGQEKRLFLKALVLHLLIGLLLKIIPFRWVPKLFSNTQYSRLRAGSTTNNEPVIRSTDTPSSVSACNNEPGMLILIKAATQRANEVSPWRNKCLIQSLAARMMLNRMKIPSQISLGIAKDGEGRRIAHSWLKIDDFEIVEKSGDYLELYRF